MPAITLLFSARDDISSVAIRTFERGRWSHVDAMMPDGSLLGARVQEIGDVPAGVQIRPPEYLPFTDTKLVSIPCDEADLRKFWSFLDDQIGKPYDETAIAAFIFNRDWRAPDSWFCSELIAAGLERCGVFPFPLPVRCNKLTPDELFLALSVIVKVGS